MNIITHVSQQHINRQKDAIIITGIITLIIRNKGSGG